MEKYSLRNKSTQTENDNCFKKDLVSHFKKTSGTELDKLNNFSRFVPRQSLSIFLAKNEIFKLIKDVHGNIVECGVFMGGGLFTWAQLSSIYEPINHNRRIVGFDSFDGFPSISENDKSSENQLYNEEGAYAFSELDELVESARLFDLNRNIGHIEKIEFVKGDAIETIPQYIDDNQHMVISLLYLDFDLYEPTKQALKHFVPRMPKGAIIAFDELNQKQWPGETMAVLEEIGLNNIEIKRFDFTPSISYAVIG